MQPIQSETHTKYKCRANSKTYRIPFGSGCASAIAFNAAHCTQKYQQRLHKAFIVPENMFVFGSSRTANDQEQWEGQRNEEHEMKKFTSDDDVFFLFVVIIIIMVMVVVNFVIRATRGSVAFLFCAGWWLHRISFEMILAGTLIRFAEIAIRTTSLLIRSLFAHNYIVSNELCFVFCVFSCFALNIISCQ